jgi:hypothetical protein
MCSSSYNPLYLLIVIIIWTVTNRLRPLFRELVSSRPASFLRYNLRTSCTWPGQYVRWVRGDSSHVIKMWLSRSITVTSRRPKKDKISLTICMQNEKPPTVYEETRFIYSETLNLGPLTRRKEVPRSFKTSLNGVHPKKTYIVISTAMRSLTSQNWDKFLCRMLQISASLHLALTAPVHKCFCWH